MSGRPQALESRDAVFCRAALQDRRGTVVANAWENVAFGVTGDASLTGANPFSSDAGIASILLQTEPGSAMHSIYGLSIIRSEGDVRIVGSSLAMRGPAPVYEIRYTIDGSIPGAGSLLYSRPLSNVVRLRAALVARGQIVAALDEATPKFRIQGSIAPKSREPFRHIPKVQLNPIPTI
jgi:hypothetical protein